MTALATILVLAGMALLALLAVVPLALEHDAERVEPTPVAPKPVSPAATPLPTRARLV